MLLIIDEHVDVHVTVYDTLYTRCGVYYMTHQAAGPVCFLKIIMIHVSWKFQFNPLPSYDVILDHCSGVVEEFHTAAARMMCKSCCVFLSPDLCASLFDITVFRLHQHRLRR